MFKEDSMTTSMEKKCACLNAKAFGLAWGTLWSAGLLFMVILAHFSGGYGANVVAALGTVYLGYSISFTGALWGMLWGFLDGLIGGFLIAWLYNYFCCCFEKGCFSCKKKD
jgi:hypothetical protein